jgi:acylphosphatase
VQQMVEWCREGPPSARVDDVQVAWEEPTGQEQSFQVRW